ncbi:MAG: DUF11 domain-containing protein [Methylococcaceae bacterium]|nr:DUF11 domain-containing protein [Methylococcaceae bacterium]
MKSISHFLCLLLLPVSVLAVDVQVSQLLDTPDPAVRGGEINYEIKLLNASDDTANDVTLSFPIPANSVYISDDNGSCNHDGNSPGQVNCNFGSITGDGLGGNVTTLNIAIKTTSSTNNTVAVTATVGTSSADTDNSNDSETQNTTIDDGADLTVSISDVADPVVAGGEISYELIVTNNGPNNAGTVTIKNTFPPAVSYSNASGTGWSCSHNSGVVTCTSASLNNGATANTITINGTVTGAVTGAITNSTTISSVTRDPDENNNTVTEDTTISSGTDLAITKSVVTPVISNGVTTFTFAPRNNGPFDVTGARIIDTFPNGFTGVAITNNGGWSCSVDDLIVAPRERVTCTLATFTTSNTNNIILTATAPVSGSFTNTAVIDNTSGMPDPVPANNSDDASATIVVDGADLTITKVKTPDPVAQGSNTTSTIRVRNLGPQTTTETITVEDTLAVGETYVSGAGTNWSCINSGASPDIVTCTYSGATLVLNAYSSYLSIITTATNAGNLTNTACVSLAVGQTDGVPANNCASATVTSTAVGVDLSIVKTATTLGGTVTTLETNENTITYTINVTNNDGTDSVNGIVMTDTIPGFVSGGTTVTVTTLPANYTCNLASSTVTCTQNSGTLAAGATDSFVITVTRPILDGSPLVNTATVNSITVGDPNRSNNSDTASVIVEPVADVELTSKTVAPATVKAGVEATYVISFKNNGPSTANGIVITDVFTPPSSCGTGDNEACTFSWISVATTKPSGSCSTDTPGANKLQCTIGSMTKGESRTVTVKIMPGWDAGNTTWTLPNTASITTTSAESIGGGDNGNNSQSQSLAIISAELDLLVNKTDLVDPVGFDIDNPTAAVIVYKVDATNRGPSLATDVVLTDKMTPKNGKQLTFLCDDAASANCVVGTSLCNPKNQAVIGPATLTLTCNIPNMAANTTTTRYLFFRIDTAPDGSGDTHENIATISSSEGDTNVNNDNESESTSVRALVDVGVTKTPSQGTVNIFEPFDWDIIVTNNGPGESVNTKLNDNLPAGMELTGAPTSSVGSCTGASADTSYVCSLGALARNASVTITAPVRLTAYPAGGTITNTATVTTFGVDSNPNNNSDDGTVIVKKSSIAGTVYSDFNDSGVQDVGESGISSVSLRLRGKDLYNNDVDTTVTTNASGAYLFDNLAPSNASGYRVTEIQPAYFTDGLESVVNVVKVGSRTSDEHASISLLADTALVDYDFGEIPQPGISGLVWGDTNDDGVLDADETARISGVKITLTGTDHLGASVNRVLVTDANGQYNFINLLPSNGVGYTVTEAPQPTAWDDGKELLGTVNGNPMGAVAADSFTGIILADAQAGINYNFGEIGGSLAGKVYRDNNDDGVVDAGEVGIENVRLTLTGTDLDGESISRTIKTDANGDYTFTSLPKSNATGYTITETQPSGIFDGKDTDGSLNNGDVSVNDVNSSIEFPNLVDASNYNFGEGGNIPITSSIAGTVFFDANDNGTQESDESGIEGVSLTLTGIDKDGNPVEKTVLTNANGDYLFSNIRPDDGDGYTVTETQPTTYEDGLDSIENVVKDGSNLTDTLHIDSLPAGRFLTDYDFGELEAAVIPGAILQGFVYADISDGGRNNGQKDVSEQGIANITVALSGLTDAGIDVCTFRNCITTTDANGNFSFSDIPPGTYTLVETHTDLPIAADGSLLFTDGKETAGIAGGSTQGTFGSQAYQNTISNIVITDALITSSQGVIDGYLFGELNSDVLGLIPPIISGYVYMDRKGVRVRPTGDGLEGQINWTAILFQNGVEICRVLTNDNGFYQFDNLHCPGHERGLPIGTGFDIAFSKDGNFLSNEAFSGGGAGQVLGSQIKGITLRSADNITEQNLPLDPSGVVYDSLTRVPVAGAEVTLTGPSGFDPSTHLVGATPIQITGSDGVYSYFLQNNFPSGVYALEITRYPDGYVSAPSEIIPVCVAGTNGVPLNVGPTPVPGLVQISSREPVLTIPLHDPAACDGMVQGGSNSTQYYFEFVITDGVSAPILTNHIPIDPIVVTPGSIVMTKSTPVADVYRGDLVPYTLTATNVSGQALLDIIIQDQLPVGFKYIEGSAVVDDVAIEPVQVGRLLKWPAIDFNVDQTHTINLISIIGSGISEGSYVNQTWAVNKADITASNIAVATVRVIPDPLFDCSDLIGKVFDDKNINGYQDEGEPGLAGVRVVTPRGLLITTDDYGRFHIACADVPNELHGSNFIMKLDTRTLPSGYRVTTENPRVVRLTRGKLVKLNFGAALHRVLRIDIDVTAFTAEGDELTSVAKQQLHELVEILKQQPFQLRLSYAVQLGEDKESAEQRQQRFADRLTELWQQCDCDHYALSIEKELLMRETATGRAQ